MHRCPAARAAFVTLFALAACDRDKGSPDPSASTPLPSPPPAAVTPAAPPRVVADHASRAFVAAGDAGTPLRIFVRREGSAAWAFQQPGATLMRMRGTALADESVIFAGKGPKADSLELRPRTDGSVELRSTLPDGGVARVVALVEGTSFRADQAKFDDGFTLRLGDIAARAQIRSDHGTVSGYYRYARSETDLALAGTVDAAGHFDITESTAGAVVTGRWSGVFLGREAAAGVWSSPDGKKELPLTMRSAPPLAALVVPDGGPGVLATIEEKSEERAAGHGCTNTLTWSNVMGLVPAARNKLVNDHIRTLLGQQETVHCDGTEDMLPWFTNIGVTVEAQAPGYMGLSVGVGSYMGGAHPNTSIGCELHRHAHGRSGEPARRARAGRPRQGRRPGHGSVPPVDEGRRRVRRRDGGRARQRGRPLLRRRPPPRGTLWPGLCRALVRRAVRGVRRRRSVAAARAEEPRARRALRDARRLSAARPAHTSVRTDARGMSSALQC